jgi:hypothetical protein
MPYFWVAWMIAGCILLVSHYVKGIVWEEGWSRCDYWPLIYLIGWPYPLLFRGPASVGRRFRLARG